MIEWGGVGWVTKLSAKTETLKKNVTKKNFEGEKRDKEEPKNNSCVFLLFFFFSSTSFFIVFFYVIVYVCLSIYLFFINFKMKQS